MNFEMKILEYKLSDTNVIKFYTNILNSGHDFYITSNCDVEEVDILVFFDSRGISSCFNGSIVEKLINYFENVNYLIVSRPIEITTWVSLYNFMKLNNIKPKKIITNMGFVDFTPKKMSVIEDIISQYGLFFDKKELNIDFIEKYTTKNSLEIDLFRVTYPLKFIRSLEKIMNYYKLIILNTPNLTLDFVFPRTRPKSFKKCIKSSNDFNKALNINSNVLNFPIFSNKLSYDGVHYTEQGNDKIFSILKKIIN
jgi:hypothetical protein